MTVGRAIVSVLAVWSLLGVLAVGLFLILRELDGVRVNLERITMGVRAIERQTVPLDTSVDAMATSLQSISDSFSASALRLTDAEQKVDSVETMFRPRD